MPYCSWDRSFEIGVDIIDAQHKRIVQYINELHELIARNDCDAVRETLGQLFDYTLSHIILEAQMMESTGHGITEAQREVQRSFAGLLSSNADCHEQGKEIPGKLLSDLMMCIMSHIKNEKRPVAA